MTYRSAALTADRFGTIVSDRLYGQDAATVAGILSRQPGSMVSWSDGHYIVRKADNSIVSIVTLASSEAQS